MKKIFAILPILFLMACGQKEESNVPPIDTAFHRTGEVTLIATIENAAVKASITGRGETRWLPEDKILAVCADGSTEEFALEGTGGTRRAIFKSVLPDGKTLGDYALYPPSAIKSFDGTTLSFELPATLNTSDSGTNSVSVAKIEDSSEIQFSQLLSYAVFELSNIPADTRAIEFFSDKNLSGTFSAAIPGALTDGVTAVDGNAPVTINTPEKPDPTMNIILPLAVGEYKSIKIIAKDINGKALSSAEALSTASVFQRGAMRSISLELPPAEKKKPKEGAILVADIYWSTGNLQHFVGQTGEGFQTDWRLAPQQWHYPNCENAAAAASAVVYLPENYDQYAHFNYGGLENPFDNVPEHAATPAVGAQLAGKLFLDRGCTVQTEDFSAAKFGDIAFWASKGKYRMPTGEEITALLSNASRQYGIYTVSPGHVVVGILFFDPVGEAPVFSDVETEFTDADLAKGVFFPYSGRRYNAQAIQVNTQGTQGPYRTGDCITGNGAVDGASYSGIFALLSAAPRDYPYFNKAIDYIAGIAIRPVLVDQN